MDEYLNKEIDLFPLLPPTVNEFKEMQEIVRVESDNFNRVRLQLIDIFKYRFVHEADEKGVALWEKMLKIKRRTTDTLEYRKFRILSKINNKLPYTIRSLKQLLNSLCGEGNYRVSLDPQSYELHFSFFKKVEDVLNLKATLEEMVPLNIWMHFIYLIESPVIKIGLREHIYPVQYPITNISYSDAGATGYVGEANVQLPVNNKGYHVVYPITGMAFSY